MRELTGGALDVMVAVDVNVGAEVNFEAGI